MPRTITNPQWFIRLKRFFGSNWEFEAVFSVWTCKLAWFMTKTPDIWYSVWEFVQISCPLSEFFGKFFKLLFPD